MLRDRLILRWPVDMRRVVPRAKSPVLSSPRAITSTAMRFTMVVFSSPLLNVEYSVLQMVNWRVKSPRRNGRDFPARNRDCPLAQAVLTAWVDCPMAQMFQPPLELFQHLFTSASRPATLTPRDFDPFASANKITGVTVSHHPVQS